MKSNWIPSDTLEGIISRIRWHQRTALRPLNDGVFRFEPGEK